MASQKENKAKRYVLAGPLNKKELCALLGVSLKVLNRWIASIKQELGEIIGYTFSVRQVEIIIARYGVMDAYKLYDKNHRGFLK